MKKIFGSLIAFFSCLLCGCSVEHLKVTKSPPSIAPNKSAEKSVTFDVESGTLKMESASLFLWPEGFNEAERVEKIRIVKSSSDKIDQLSVEQWKLAKLESTLVSQWETLQCVAKYADLPADTDPEDVEEVDEWKSSEFCGDVGQCTDDSCRSQVDTCQNELKSCQDNQEQRKTIPEKRDKLLSEQKTNLIAIYKQVDPEFPAKQVNYKKTDPRNSNIKIFISDDKNSRVEVTFKNLFEEGTLYSTDQSLVDAAIANNKPASLVQNASYEFETKLLKFSLREFKKVVPGESYRNAVGALVVAEKAGIVATSGIYTFNLERAQNFAPDTINMVRFTGDVKLNEIRLDGGAGTRSGSTKIDGYFR